MLSFIYDGITSERLDKILMAQLEESVSREKIKKLIKQGLCTVDNSPCFEPSRKIISGQILSIVVPKEQTMLVPEDGEVTIIWHDDYLIVIDKPAGLTVHPAPSCLHGTLIQRLLSLCPSLGEHGGWRPGIVHRLDKDTSGLILVAPDEKARLLLAQAFAERTVQKTYLALVDGCIAPEGVCQEPMGRHPNLKTRMAVVPGGRSAHTEWTRLYVDPLQTFSLIMVRLHTGRTHQIRVHMAHLGHPLLGDSTYAPKEVAARAPRQMLHAWKLAFEHPLTHEKLTFMCPPPLDMTESFLALSEHTEKVVITGLPGCGKSRLTRIIQEQNFPAWSADEAVRISYEPDGQGWQILHHRYRGAFTTKGSPVNKSALAEAIRETPGMREELESLIHPIVNQSLLEFWNSAEADGSRFAFAEVPLWLECGGSNPKYGPKFGQVTLVGVHCPTVIRHQRLIQYRHWQESMVLAADSWQWPEDKKMAACDLVVDNSGDESMLIHHGLDLLAELEKRYEQRRGHMRSMWNAMVGS